MHQVSSGKPLRSLSYIKTVSTHTMDYIDTATTGTLSPHILPIMDLKKMLSHIEETLPSNLHLPVSSEDTLHFYCNLCTHVLIANKQFLLLIDVPIQDQSQQLSIYKIFTLNIPQCNFTACYDISTKYLRITQDETMAVEISPQQPRICQEANGQFCTIPTPFQPLSNPPSCITAFYTKNTASIFCQMFFTDQEIFRCQHALSTCTKCLDINNHTISSSSHSYPHIPRRNNTFH